jgi:hypothetical protein
LSLPATSLGRVVAHYCGRAQCCSFVFRRGLFMPTD